MGSLSAPSSATISISKLSVEHYESGLGIGHASPRLSWRFDGDAEDWTQVSYDVKVDDQTYHVESANSVLVPWPSQPLRSREAVKVSVRANGTGLSTAWSSLDVEAAYLSPDDWSAKAVSCEVQPKDQPKRPFLVRKTFTLPTKPSKARVYVTALGLYELILNGKKVGDHLLAPGWRSYDHYLDYQTFDVGHLLVEGENEIGAWVAEGWHSGRLGFLGGRRNIYGERNGLVAQFELDGRPFLITDSAWEWSYGPLLSSELYDGETYDFGLEDRREWAPVEVIDAAKGVLISSEKPPTRRIEEIVVKDIFSSPSGKTLVDFGVNFVGWIRLNRLPSVPAGSKVVLRHAEVLEDGELGVRPLRICKAIDTIILGSATPATFEPRFTFHGFRYLEVTGFDDLKADDLTGICIHTDMEATGHFETNHGMVNQLWQNVKRSMKGNFVSVPTDCPQRDERLGWTGDLNVFAKTASFIYDTSGILRSWLKDVAADQADADGVVPVVVPNVLQHLGPEKPIAAWGDVAVTVPSDLRDAFGDDQIVKDQWASMKSWLDEGVKYGPTGLWTLESEQLGDWLDPAAPPDRPGDSVTDPYLVADAFLLHSLETIAQLAHVLGEAVDAAAFEKRFQRTKAAFLDEYVTATGRLVGDTQTAHALVLNWGLLEGQQREKAIDRLGYLVRRKVFSVSTGFAGTPIILDTLAESGRLDLAYRMLLEKKCPSWLYPVSMGATTTWERWDSMLPDGSINPGEMTSFNHYALGAVASFMHTKIGGISPLAPGWKRILIAPQPQPGSPITNAKVSHLSPYGLISCEWTLSGEDLKVDVVVPPNSTAQVVLPGVDDEVGSGRKTFYVVLKATKGREWPPKSIEGFCEHLPEDEID